MAWALGQVLACLARGHARPAAGGADIGDGTGQKDKRSAEDAREYAQRLRSLPVDQVLGDVLFSLLQAAQVKLCRQAARLLIDVTAMAHEHARPYLPGELTRPIDQVLGQLRLGQVSAESHASQQGQPEENYPDRAPARRRPGQRIDAARPPRCVVSLRAA